METAIQTERTMPFEIVRALVETYYDYQKTRIIASNRILGNKELMTEENIKTFGLESFQKDNEIMEKNIKKIFKQELLNHPIYTEYLSGIHGIAGVLSMGLIAYIEDPAKFKHTSNLWSYAGMGMVMFCNDCNHVVTEEIEIKKRKGTGTTKAKRITYAKECSKCGGENLTAVRQRKFLGCHINYNPKFKRLCWNLGQTFMFRQPEKSGYRKIFDMVKENERRKHPNRIEKDGRILYNDGHINNRALRQVQKIFLSHLRDVWSRMNGIEVSQPFASEILGHHIIKPFMDREPIKKGKLYDELMNSKVS